MKFSICIPNYNYGTFLERTLRSVLQQSYDDFEILVSDNASNDDSVDVVRRIGDPRIKLSVNRCNVGFAGNLDRAVRDAVGNFVILLSSDDVMRPGALETYARVYSLLGDRAETTVLCASCDLIDEHDRTTGRIDLPGRGAWRDSDRDGELSAALGEPTLRVAADKLLHRSLAQVQNPFTFCATAYPRTLYEAVEGYGGNRLFGPDKRFHWRLLGVAESAVLIRRPLFGYRVHSQNQLAQQSQSGALKYLIDGYMNSFETEAALLAKAGLTRTDLEGAFVEYEIVRHGLALLSEGKRTTARRTLDFGRAAYPRHVRRNWRAWAVRLLLMTGPIGSWIAGRLRARLVPDKSSAEYTTQVNGDYSALVNREE